MWFHTCTCHVDYSQFNSARTHRHETGWCLNPQRERLNLGSSGFRSITGQMALFSFFFLFFCFCFFYVIFYISNTFLLYIFLSYTIYASLCLSHEMWRMKVYFFIILKQVIYGITKDISVMFLTAVYDSMRWLYWGCQQDFAFSDSHLGGRFCWKVSRIMNENETASFSQADLCHVTSHSKICLARAQTVSMAAHRHVQ